MRQEAGTWMMAETYNATAMAWKGGTNRLERYLESNIRRTVVSMDILDWPEQMWIPRILDDQVNGGTTG